MKKFNKIYKKIFRIVLNFTFRNYQKKENLFYFSLAFFSIIFFYPLRIFLFLAFSNQLYASTFSVSGSSIGISGVSDNAFIAPCKFHSNFTIQS